MDEDESVSNSPLLSYQERVAKARKEKARAVEPEPIREEDKDDDFIEDNNRESDIGDLDPEPREETSN